MKMKSLDKKCDKIFHRHSKGIKPTGFEKFLVKLNFWLYDPIGMIKIKMTNKKIQRAKNRR